MFKEVFNLSNAGLFSQIALLIFLGVFIATAVRLMFFSRREMKHAARLPLDDAQVQE